MEEKEKEEKELDMNQLKKNLRDAKFLKRTAQYHTMEKQMNGVEEECQKLSRDVRDTFHVVGTEKKGDKTVLHIVTSGKKGEESARQALTELSEAEEVDIENKSTERYEEEKDEERRSKEARALFECLRQSPLVYSQKGGD